MGQGLSFFGQKPVHEELGRVWMRRIGKHGNAATRATRTNQTYLLGQKNLLDRQTFFRQRGEFFGARGDRLERESSAHQPCFQDAAIIGKRHSRVEQISPDPLLAAVGLEITVDHLSYSRRIAHSLPQDFSLPAWIEKVGLFFYGRDVRFLELVRIVPTLVLVLFSHMVNEYKGGYLVRIPVPAEVPARGIANLRMYEQRRERHQGFRRHQPLVVLPAANQCDVHDVPSGFSLSQHAVDGVGGVAG